MSATVLLFALVVPPADGRLFDEPHIREWLPQADADLLDRVSPDYFAARRSGPGAAAEVLRRTVPKIEDTYVTIRMWEIVADLEVADGDSEAAVEALRAAAAVATDKVLLEDIHFKLARTLIRAGRTDEAERVVDRLPDRTAGEIRTTSDLIGHTRRAQLYMMLGRVDEARVSYLSGTPPADAAPSAKADYKNRGAALGTMILVGKPAPGSGQTRESLRAAAANFQTQLLRQAPEGLTHDDLLRTAKAWRFAGDTARGERFERLLVEKFPESRSVAELLIRAARNTDDRAKRLRIYERALTHPGADESLRNAARAGLGLPRSPEGGRLGPGPAAGARPAFQPGHDGTVAVVDLSRAGFAARSRLRHQRHHGLAGDLRPQLLRQGEPHVLRP